MGRILIALAVACALIAGAPGAVLAAEEKLPSKAAKGCLKCHQFDKESGVYAGKLASVSRKAKTIQLKINSDMQVIYFDDKTVLKNAETMKRIPKNESVKITYYVKDGKQFAKEVEVKKGLEVPKDQLASVEEVAALVAKGPEKGKYVLIDSRPKVRYNEGHVPTAKAMPFFAFDKLKDKLLPKDKGVLQIYYCGGFT